MYNPIFVSKELINPDNIENPNMRPNVWHRAVAISVATFALAGCSFQQGQAEPAEPSGVEADAETALPKTPTPEVSVEDEATPEEKLEELNQQLNDLFMRVYTGDVPGEFSLNIQKGEEYSGTRYYEATAGEGEKLIRLAMEAPGEDSSPNSNKATFVSVKLVAIGAGGLEDPDNPEGEVGIAEVNLVKTEENGKQISGETFLGYQFSTNGVSGKELDQAFKDAEETLEEISDFLNK